MRFSLCLGQQNSENPNCAFPRFAVVSPLVCGTAVWDMNNGCLGDRLCKPLISSCCSIPTHLLYCSLHTVTSGRSCSDCFSDPSVSPWNTIPALFVNKHPAIFLLSRVQDLLCCFDSFNNWRKASMAPFFFVLAFCPHLVNYLQNPLSCSIFGSSFIF